MKKTSLFVVLTVGAGLFAVSCGNSTKTMEQKDSVDSYPYNKVAIAEYTDVYSLKAEVVDSQVVATYVYDGDTTKVNLCLNGANAVGVHIVSNSCYIITSDNKLLEWTPWEWAQEGTYPCLARPREDKYNGVHTFKVDTLKDDYGFDKYETRVLDAKDSLLSMLDYKEGEHLGICGSVEGTFASILSIDDDYIMFRDEKTQEIYEGFCHITNGKYSSEEFIEKHTPYEVEYTFVSHIAKAGAQPETCSLKGKLKVVSHPEYTGLWTVTPLEGFAFTGSLNQPISFCGTW